MGAERSRSISLLDADDAEAYVAGLEEFREGAYGFGGRES